VRTEKPAGPGYLGRILAAGARPFRYRSRVWSLLGVPQPGGVTMQFPQALPFAGFSYLRPSWADHTEAPDQGFTGTPQWITEAEKLPGNRTRGASTAAPVRPVSPGSDVARTRPQKAEPSAPSLAQSQIVTSSAPPAQGHASASSQTPEASAQPGNLPKPETGQPRAANPLKGSDIVIPSKRPNSSETRPENEPRTQAAQPATPLVPPSQSAREIVGPARNRAPQTAPPTRTEAVTGAHHAPDPTAPAVPRPERAAERRAVAATERTIQVEQTSPHPMERKVASPVRTSARQSPARLVDRRQPEYDRDPVPSEPFPSHRTHPMPYVRAQRRRADSGPDHSTEPTDSVVPPPPQQQPQPVVVVRQATPAMQSTPAFWERRHLMNARVRILR
jgi:hypothetical protein